MGRLPVDNNQPYGISSADSTQPLHALAGAILLEQGDE
jgi:hypothetical protein